MAITTMIGAKIHRREDPRLVSGEGHYVDDFTRQGTVSLFVVRSPFAHARIKSIDITQATKAPGVVAIYTHKDFAKVLSGIMPVTPSFVAEKKHNPPRFPIADKEVVTRASLWRWCWPRPNTRRPTQATLSRSITSSCRR